MSAHTGKKFVLQGLNADNCTDEELYAKIDQVTEATTYVYGSDEAHCFALD